MKRILFFLLFFIPFISFAQIPEPTNRVVNDYAHLLSNSQVAELESRLRNFYDSTGSCILVIITPDLGDYAVADYAQRVGEKWGVGGKKYDNGLVVVVKPKNKTYGEAFIATGYGLEGALPDVSCKRIVEDYMLPYFKNEDYWGGINAALDVICPVVAKEYTFEEIQQQNEDTDASLLVGFLFLGIVGLILYLGIKAYRTKHPNKKKLALKEIEKATNLSEFEKAIEKAHTLKVRSSSINRACGNARKNCMKKISNATSNRGMLDAMVLARDFGISEAEVMEARTKGVAHIIAMVGTARTIAQFDTFVREARVVGATDAQILAGKEKAIKGILKDIESAPSAKIYQDMLAAAQAFGIPSSRIEEAKAAAGKNSLLRMQTASSHSEIASAAEIAAAAGIAMAVILAARLAAEKRLNNPGSTSFGNIRPGTGGFGGGSSAGKSFGGFGGGHFGGGGGGARW